MIIFVLIYTLVVSFAYGEIYPLQGQAELKVNCKITNNDEGKSQLVSRTIIGKFFYHKENNYPSDHYILYMGNNQEMKKRVQNMHDVLFSKKSKTRPICSVHIGKVEYEVKNILNANTLTKIFPYMQQIHEMRRDKVELDYPRGKVYFLDQNDIVKIKTLENKIPVAVLETNKYKVFPPAIIANKLHLTSIIEDKKILGIKNENNEIKALNLEEMEVQLNQLKIKDEKIRNFFLYYFHQNNPPYSLLDMTRYGLLNYLDIMPLSSGNSTRYFYCFLINKTRLRIVMVESIQKYYLPKISKNGVKDTVLNTANIGFNIVIYIDIESDPPKEIHSEYQITDAHIFFLPNGLLGAGNFPHIGVDNTNGNKEISSQLDSRNFFDADNFLGGMYARKKEKKLNEGLNKEGNTQLFSFQ